MVDETAKYKDLNKIQSFSEQRYAVVQLMEQARDNDEYLKREVERLDYLSPPAVRKRWNPACVDAEKSYGFQINSVNPNEKTITFSTDTRKVVAIDFTDESLIDSIVGEVQIEKYVDSSGVIHRRAVLPKKSVVSEDFNTKNLADTGQINSFWYVGYNKSKSYALYPEWLKDWRDAGIPSVVRAQTFKAGKTGLLESVSLNIATEAANNVGWGSPLIVQIWPTKSEIVDKTTWDNKKKKTVKASGSETIHVPLTKTGGVETIYAPLAEAVFDPKFATPGFQSFVFDNPCQVTKNEYYAIVVFCPLAHWETAPRVGGWGRNCSHRYNDGDAFLSENNGRTFVRYGKNDSSKINYKLGKYTPQDFAFECKIIEEHEHYVDYATYGDSYIYFKPIHSNPITGVTVASVCSGRDDASRSNGVYVDFEYSTTGNRNNEDEWFSIGSSRSAVAGGPTVLFVRARMHQTSTNNALTPNIQSVTITVDTNLPRAMYVRTVMYNPKITPMLGASVWGRVNAPFTVEPGVTCTAEIIQDKIIKENYHIITVEELDQYTYLSSVDESKITGKSNDDRCSYLVDNPSVIEALKNENVYVKPYTYSSNSNITKYLSFDGGEDELGNQLIAGLMFSKSPAYPIHDCIMQPHGEGYFQSYGEWYDYTVDYDEDTLIFDENVINNMPVGSLSIEYNPIFIQGLSADEMPVVLDYFEETIQVTDDVLEDRYVILRASAVDPLRHVYLNKDTDEEIELKEDSDFTVDYLNNKLIFTVLDNNGTTCLTLNDILTIVYTPNIEETGIAIGYYAKRESNALNKQCSIKPNYLEYKV